MREALGKLASGLLKGVLDAVFPAVCVGCGKEERYLCKRCEGLAGEVALLCPICKQGSLTGENHLQCRNKYGLDGFASCWEYEGVMKSLLHTIKYTGVTHAAKETTERAFILMMQDIKRFQAFLTFLSLPETFITYVPMYRKKERFRGFNQAALFAREVSIVSRRPVVSTLEKISDTKPQVDLSKGDRLLNVKGVFVPSIKQDFVGVRNVILVDDVWTTGATMEECCTALKRAGVEKVWGFTIARTP